jgi:UDP-glucose 4-epimerase
VVRVFVSGGAGFVGSHLVEMLLEQGHEPLVVDNFATARRDTAADLAGVELVEETIADRAAMDDLFARFRPELVVHCAAAYKDPDDWDEDVRTNAIGTANLVQASVASGVGRLIYFQTALCYGNRPLEQPVTLSHPLRPESSYAISKTAGEHYVVLGDLDFVSFRLANVYGPRNISGPVPTFFQRLSEGKSCFAVDTRRDFIFVGDLVEIVAKAIAGQGNGVYHVSSGRDFSIKEVYDAVAAAMDVQEPVEERERAPDDTPTILLDPSRTEAEFGWRPQTPLEEGIRRTVEWYGEHGVQETYTHLRMRD